ncbi:unnamed protein product [Fraxinus pennsylvanica]|uniref:Protein kinase domain-containing protein n=1 Tax=Fraxinus pennsylvanica TaxID=56036 RepID=A0AAD2DZF8_9LAMI|nr:unnamed protein product [Fraxinus pennsylvanica]
MAAAELNHNKKTRLVLIFVGSLICGMLILALLIFCLIKRRKEERASENNEKDIELPIFDLTTVTTATMNFSLTNVIGEGGFGIVYKGTLSTGQEVAVKRLSKNSGQDQTESKTERVVGTYGYMSPEYAAIGKFSVKSDVYSFGVLLLEIVSGRKNRTFKHPDHHHNLVGHAWLLWKEGRAMELVDGIYELSSNESEVIKCIHIGLLCVQKLPEDRPTMSSVVVMLSNEGVILPQPKEPGYFMEISCTGTDMSTSEERCLTHNEVTTSVLEAR